MCYETQDQDMIQDMAEEAPVHESGDTGSRLEITTEDFSRFQDSLKKGLHNIQQEMEALSMIAEIPISRDVFYKENIQFEIILVDLLKETANTVLSIIKAGNAVRNNSINYLVGGDEGVDRGAVEDAHMMRVKYETVKQYLNSIP